MKNIIKHIKLIIIPAILILGFSQCDKDMLEKPTRPGDLTDVTYYKSLEGMEHFLNTAYQSLSEYIMTGLPQAYISIGSIRSDDAWAGGENYSDSPQNHDMNEFRIYSDNVNIENFWEHFYQSIRYCNVVLDNIEFTKKANPDDIATANNYIAQALVLRAFGYFNLVRAYGDVPLLTYPTLEQLPRTPAADVYTQVVADLEQAIDMESLERADEMADEDKGRVGIGTAKALLAKVHMYLAAFEPEKANEHYQSAYNLAKEVINSGEFSLVSNYSQLWDFDDHFGTESIFEIGYPEPGSAFSVHHWYCTWMRPRYVYEIDSRVKMGLDGNCGWGFNTPTQDFVNAFEPGDPRLHWTVWFPGDSTRGLTNDGKLHEICFANSETGYYYRKTTSETHYERDNAAMGWKIYRYSDLLLIGAEAANEIGQSADALAWLNKVRERARNTPAAPYHEDDKIEGIPADVTITDQAELRNIIRHERRVELGCEGERFFDLKRWHGTHGYDLAKIIQDAAKVVGPDYQVTIDEPKSGKPREPKEIIVDMPTHLLLPIPRIEIENTNGMIEQNPGY